MRLTAFIFLFILSVTAHAKTYEELVFLKEFANKDAQYVQDKLGKPDSIVKKENAGGIVQFWVYSNLVQQGKSDKLYKFTQVGIVNDYVETLGHTNRQPK